jgi:RimJ/RimL family protein N-acetyltransferase
MLRAFRPEDAPVFSAYRSDPEVARYQGWTPPFSLEQAQAFIKDMSHVTPGAPGQWYQIAIELKTSGELIGDVAFQVEENFSQQAVIAYTLAQAFHHQGYASEAVSRLLQYLFGTLELHRVIAYIDVENPASFSLLEKQGFRREGHHIENIWFKGAWASEYVYALLAREWKTRQKSS